MKLPFLDTVYILHRQESKIRKQEENLFLEFLNHIPLLPDFKTTVNLHIANSDFFLTESCSKIDLIDK